MGDYEFELPFDGVSEDELESGGKIPAGWYRAICTDFYANQKDSGWKAIFKITRGAYSNREVHLTLFDHTESEDQEKGAKVLAKNLLIFGRLGARQPETGKINLRAAHNKECVIHLELKKVRWCEGCGISYPKANGRKCENCGGTFEFRPDEDSFANITYDGVFPIDHAKIPKDARIDLDLGPAAGSGETAEPAPPKKATAQPRSATRSPSSSPSTQPPTSMSREERLKQAMSGF